VVGVFAGLQRGLMHEATNGKVSHQEPVRLLPDQFRSLAAQDDLGAPQVGFQLVQRRLDFPALVIECRQFFRGSQSGIQNRGDQAIDRLRSGHILQTIFDHAYRDRVAVVAAVRDGSIHTTEVGAIGEAPVHLQARILADSPEQFGTRPRGLLPKFVAGEKRSARHSMPFFRAGTTACASVSSSVA